MHDPARDESEITSLYGSPILPHLHFPLPLQNEEEGFVCVLVALVAAVRGNLNDPCVDRLRLWKFCSLDREVDLQAFVLVAVVIFSVGVGRRRSPTFGSDVSSERLPRLGANDEVEYRLRDRICHGLLLEEQFLQHLICILGVQCASVHPIPKDGPQGECLEHAPAELMTSGLVDGEISRDGLQRLLVMVVDRGM